MIRQCLLLAALTVAPPAVAAPSCAVLTQFLGAAPDLAGASCTATRTSAGLGHACFWQHPYRAAAAFEMFDAQVAAVTTCLPEAALLPPADGVNHPDTHDVREFALADTRLTVSLKDKSQLGQTLVFLIKQPQ